MIFNDRRKPLGKITGVKSTGFKKPLNPTNEWSFSGARFSNREAQLHGANNVQNWGTPAKNPLFSATEANDGFRVLKKGSKPLTAKPTGALNDPNYARPKTKPRPGKK